MFYPYNYQIYLENNLYNFIWFWSVMLLYCYYTESILLLKMIEIPCGKHLIYKLLFYLPHSTKTCLDITFIYHR